MPHRKQYVGDGIYVEFDGYGLVLTTEDGIAVQNRIVIEPHEWRALQRIVHTWTADRGTEPPLDSVELDRVE